MKPYYEDENVTLYLGDCREIVPALGITGDLVCTDPPYQCTSLEWDRWVDGWPSLAATVASSMWCFGSMRMFMDQRGQFASWQMSQDVVWAKTRGTSRTKDRFARSHEIAIHWYRGPWARVHHDTPKVQRAGVDKGTIRASAKKAAWNGALGSGVWVDDGTRLMLSVMSHPSLSQRSPLHPTEKPVGLLRPLIEYACPPGGTVVDLFAGSGSTLDAARQTGRKAIGIEASEVYLEKAAQRLSQQLLFTGEGPG